MLIETEGLLGREQELAAVGRFLATIEERSASLVLEGEPGIGKTVLAGHALDDARRRGYRILSARPTSAESALSFVGLTDLLSETSELFANLPAPQRRALEVALLLEDSGDAPPDPRAIGMGLLGVLRALAASRPVVVAVDDLQWLDRASAGALAFALRRVTDESIGLLTALRKDSPAGDLAGSLREERIALGPLSIGAIHALLAERLELSIPRSLLLRIHDGCRGNPLFALEIGRALQERGLPEPGRPFEIPDDAETLFADRLDQLPEETLDVLAIAAASAAPTRSLLGASASSLEPALEAEIVCFEGEHVRFTHPLLASAVYTRLDSPSARELHRRIAAVVTDREQRARHLALAAHGPDPRVAAALDEAVDQAARRGAPTVAAELAELALELTPRDDVTSLRTRRRIAAENQFVAGDVVRSREILEPFVEELPSGTERARALMLLAETRSGDLNAMLPLREEAVAEAVGDDRVLVEALRWLGHTLFVAGKPVEALARAREAVDAARRVGDPRLMAMSLAYVAWVEIWNGELTPGLLAEALSLEEHVGYLRVYESPAMVDGIRLMVLEGDLDAARVRLADAERIARDHGDEEARAILLAQLATLETRAGRFEDALRHATESYELREQFGLGTGAHLYSIALAEALLGRARAAQAAAERGLALCEETGNEIFTVRNSFVLGFLALSVGDIPSAARILAPLPERLAAGGYGRVNILQVLPDAIEATIADGDLGRGANQLAELEETARLGIPYALQRAARCRGLLAAARRDYGAAVASFEEALSADKGRSEPLEHGRTLLALGQTQRRAGRRRDARTSLQRALAIFQEVGAALWTQQVRDELGRLGGRTSSEGALTGAEERVARLVAEGKTNREVAAALFVTTRTVETHLTSIYRKLDLRSRSELARRLVGENPTRIS